MSRTYVVLKKEEKRKYIPVGFSLPILIAGPLVLLLRKDVFPLLGMLITQAIFNAAFPVFSFFVLNLLYAVRYNKWSQAYYLNKGWELVNGGD